MFRIICLLCCCIGAPYLLPAQAQAESKFADQLTVLSEAIMAEEPGWKETYFNPLIQKAQKMDSLQIWLKAFRMAGDRLDRLGESKAGIQFLKQGASQLFRAPANPAENYELGKIYTLLGYIYNISYGQYLEAAFWYEKASSFFQDKLPEKVMYKARYVDHELANIYTRLGEYRAAETLLKHVAERTAVERPSWSAEALSDLVLIYRDNEDFEKALETTQGALDMEDVEEHVEGLLKANLSNVYYEQGQYQRALGLNREARRIFASPAVFQRKSKGFHWLGAAHVMEAKILLELGQIQKAERALLTTDSLYSAHFRQYSRREFGKLYVYTGEFYLENNEGSKALDYFHRALKTILPEFQDADPYALPLEEILYAENTIIDALSGKIAVLKKEDTVEKLTTALACYDLIFAVEKKLRQEQSYFSSRLFNVKILRQRSQDAIEIALALQVKTGDVRYSERAFGFAEKSKSLLLIEAAQRAKARQFAGNSDPLIDEEVRIKRAISDLEEEIVWLEKSGIAKDVSQAKEELLTLRQALNKIEKEIIRRPSSFENAPLPSLLQIQAELLKEGQSIVEYYVCPTKVWAFVIQPTGPLKIVDLGAPSNLNQDVEAFVTSMEKFQLTDGAMADSLCGQYTTLAHELYNQCWAPLGNLGSMVMVIPSGPLSLIPFSALLTAAPSNACRFKTYPYLAKEQQLSYAYSVTHQWLLRQDNTSNHTKKWLGLAPDFSQSAVWGNTRYAIPGVQNLAALTKGDPLIGSDATIKQFLELAPLYSWIHFSTHAQADAHEGDLSFVVFSDPEGGFDSLFTQRLYHVSIPADMVVLGACETGAGSMATGEGVISLARGFFYAGAKSVITTLWKVNDQSTNTLLASFYQYLLKGKSKDEALRLAQLDFVDQMTVDRFAHPVYWAGFIPMGEMQGSGQSNKVLYFLLPFALLMFLFIPIAQAWRKKVRAKQ